MKLLSRIIFPAAVVSSVAAAALGPGASGIEFTDIPGEICLEAADTVVYPRDAYKLRRVADLGEWEIADSLLKAAADSGAVADTLPHLSARDTIKAPDSLRFTDPFRYKYYVALCDSLTHREVRDSLLKRVDSLKRSSLAFKLDSNFTAAASDSLYARLDSIDRFRLDSLYAADSTAAAKAAFLAWYNSLSKADRKKYDMEQYTKVKMKELDSLKKVKEKRQAEKDSITENTPRILETFAVPDSLHYKRIIVWNVDDDFHKIAPAELDTSYNYHFYDFPFQRADVNSSWLGVAGSPVQPYDWFKRRSDAGVEFYDAMESWSFSPRTLPQYNTKTPYTELAYWGTLAGTKSKQSNNIHILTTQNITPAFNITLLADKFGGGGFLANEDTRNTTLAAGANYLGRRYLLHAGIIHNKVTRNENGGIVETDKSGLEGNFWIRDTTVDSREIPISLSNASSKVLKNSFFLDQQLRIPFNFIEKLRHRGDTSFVLSDTLNRNITTAFIGHSSEWSAFTRTYTDKIGATDVYGRNFYHDAAGDYVWFHDQNASNDSLRVTDFDNKLFIKLQPWGEDAIVSKLNIGIGDRLRQYFDSTSIRPQKHTENSFYIYAGAEGRFRKYIEWDAKADYTLAGYNFADFGLQANAKFNVYPFRRARKSPVSLGLHFSSELREPGYYQQHLNLNHFRWDNEFGKISTTRLYGNLDIPHWKLKAGVGYALLGNNIYYDTLGIARQNGEAMSILSASLRKDFVFGPLHLENQALFQFSSKPDIVPLPAAAVNLRWFFQFVVQKDESGDHNVMVMQIGANGFWNTAWNAPAWNPEFGVFHNQNRNLYHNGPWFDLFVNVQWKRACIFIKYQNMGRGWPMEKADYFSADHYIITQPGIDGLKFGIFWPFYIQPHQHSAVSGGASGGGRSSSGGGLLGGGGGGLLGGANGLMAGSKR